MYEIPQRCILWDMAAMAKQPNKKAESERRALILADKLERVRPADLSERQWCIKAGVSASFFSNLRGTPTKAPSEPTVGNLRLVLEQVDLSIPEFFVEEAVDRIFYLPSRQALERAIADALPGLPKAADKRAGYLLSTVTDALRLPAGLRDDPANDAIPEEDETAKGSPVHQPTN